MESEEPTNAISNGPSYMDNYQAVVLPAIREALLSSAFDDVSVVTSSYGPPVRTSAALLAAVSPWLRSLMEAAGGEELRITIPAISSGQLADYLAGCLAPDGGAAERDHEIDKLLNPKVWKALPQQPPVGSQKHVLVVKSDVKMEAFEQVMDDFDYDNERGNDDDDDPWPGEEDYEEGQIDRRRRPRYTEDFSESDEEEEFRPKKRDRKVVTKKEVDSQGRPDSQPKKRGRPRKAIEERTIYYNNKKCLVNGVLEPEFVGKVDVDTLIENERAKQDKKVFQKQKPDTDFSDDDDHEDESADSSGDELVDCWIKREKGETKEKKKRNRMSKIPDEIICSDCGEGVKKRRTKDGGFAFRKHQMMHKVEKFTCDCTGLPDGVPLARHGRDFALKERHMKVEHMGWTGCTECDHSFENKQKLAYHTKIRHNGEQAGKRKRRRRLVVKWPDTLLCPDCGEDIGTKAKGNKNKDGGAHIKRHQLKHQVENFTCDCPDVPKLVKRVGQERVNKDFMVIERHMKEVHWGWFGCSECMLTFEKQEELADHSEKHKQSFVCDLCGFETQSRYKLTEHNQRKHTATPPIPCPECGKMLATEAALKAHRKKVHTSSVCPVCGVTIKNLKIHMEEMHIADAEKKFHCEDCGKGFMTKQRIDSHRMNNHIKTQPYRCRYGCENSYNDRSNRNAHERRRHGRLYTIDDPRNANLTPIFSE